MFANNDVTIQWLPLSEKFVHKANAIIDGTSPASVSIVKALSFNSE